MQLLLRFRFLEYSSVSSIAILKCHLTQGINTYHTLSGRGQTSKIGIDGWGRVVKKSKFMKIPPTSITKEPCSFGIFQGMDGPDPCSPSIRELVPTLRMVLCNMVSEYSCAKVTCQNKEYPILNFSFTI